MFSFINVRFHHKEDQPAEVVKLMTLYVMENSRLVVGQPMESSCIVFNMEGFTLSNMVSNMVCAKTNNGDTDVCIVIGLWLCQILVVMLGSLLSWNIGPMFDPQGSLGVLNR